MIDEPLTLSVPEAGKRYFGLSRTGSYAAAEDGTIPTIRVGKLLRVPIRAMERMLDAASLPPPTKDRSRRAKKRKARFGRISERRVCCKRCGNGRGRQVSLNKCRARQFHVARQRSFGSQTDNDP